VKPNAMGTPVATMGPSDMSGETSCDSHCGAEYGREKVAKNRFENWKTAAYNADIQFDACDNVNESGIVCKKALKAKTR